MRLVFLRSRVVTSLSLDRDVTSITLVVILGLGHIQTDVIELRVVLSVRFLLRTGKGPHL